MLKNSLNQGIEPLDLRKQCLGYNEQERLRQEISILENEIKYRNNLKINGVDAYIPDDVYSEMVKKLKRKKIAFERNKAPHVSGKDKDILYQEAKQLEEKIKELQLTKKELYEEDPIKLAQITQRHMKNYDKLTEMEMRYKNIMRRLEPDNPEITDVNKFRR